MANATEEVATFINDIAELVRGFTLSCRRPICKPRPGPDHEPAPRALAAQGRPQCDPMRSCTCC